MAIECANNIGERKAKLKLVGVYKNIHKYRLYLKLKRIFLWKKFYLSHSFILLKYFNWKCFFHLENLLGKRFAVLFHISRSIVFILRPPITFSYLVLHRKKWYRKTTVSNYPLIEMFPATSKCMSWWEILSRR